MGKPSPASTDDTAAGTSTGRRADKPTRGLDAAQRARLGQVAHDVALLYPDNAELQQAAVDAAIDYLHGDADLGAISAEWHRIQNEEKRLEARVRQLAVMALADKRSSERSLSRAIPVERMRLRRWSGK